jgi:hypothetical protein
VEGDDYFVVAATAAIEFLLPSIFKKAKDSTS